MKLCIIINSFKEKIIFFKKIIFYDKLRVTHRENNLSIKSFTIIQKDNYSN